MVRISEIPVFFPVTPAYGRQREKNRNDIEGGQLASRPPDIES